jgi:2-keto-4-pentenoate hydratase
MNGAASARIALGQRLAGASAEGQTLGTDGLPALATLDEAEQVQDAFLRAAAFRPCAWKLGASTFGARRALGLPRSFLAPLPAPRVLTSPARLAMGQLRQRGVECELAVTLRGLDAAERRMFGQAASADSLALTRELVTACHAAIEIPESRFARLGAAGPLALVADNGAAGWVVLGPAGAVDVMHGPAPGRLELDGVPAAEGDASAFVDSPLRLVQAFLHQAVCRGLLPEGPTSVLLGSVTPYHALAGPARVVVRFDGLAPAELHLVG